MNPLPPLEIDEIRQASASSPAAHESAESAELASLSSVDVAARWIVGLAIYVASIGPMYWHWHAAKFVNGPKWIAVLYEPLYLASNFKPVGRWLNWYIQLWIE
ncbi:MAG: hypothetical protein KF774_02550 [Planctomyces sp.]|nr:hypothetical protein [Planctomyces sp.]